MRANDTAMNGIEAAIHGRRLPQRVRVRSLQTPTIGSLTASHTLVRPSRTPTAAGAMARTSVAKFIRYIWTKKKGTEAPKVGSPYASSVRSGSVADAPGAPGRLRISLFMTD